MTEAHEGRYGLRKRRRIQEQEGDSGLEKLLTAAESAGRILVFSGSGLSASSGMSTFSTKGGLYERAQQKFKLQDGKTLFTYSFYERNRLDALAFFADIYLEAAKAKAAPGHHALADLQRAGRLQRHYTLNIDGLAERVGMDTWHPEENPQGSTVELHGNIHHLVCVECGDSTPLTQAAVRQLRARTPIPCATCPPSEDGINGGSGGGGGGEDAGNGSGPSRPFLRFKVMLYEDAEGEWITPEEVMDLMEEDTKAADLILWTGISFQQSASTAYFRKVRHWLQEAGKLDKVVQAVVNPSEDALWNLMTASSNQHELNVVEILASSDDVLPSLVRHITNGTAPTAPRRNSPAPKVSKEEEDDQIEAPLAQKQKVDEGTDGSNGHAIKAVSIDEAKASKAQIPAIIDESADDLMLDRKGKEEIEISDRKDEKEDLEVDSEVEQRGNGPQGDLEEKLKERRKRGGGSGVDDNDDKISSRDDKGVFRIRH